MAGPAAAASGPPGTDLRIPAARAGETPDGQLIVRINRILRPGDAAPASDVGPLCVSATWRAPDGTQVRGVLATARYHDVR